jgi:hypothetical protein
VPGHPLPLTVPALALGLVELAASCGSPPRTYTQPPPAHFSATSYRLTVDDVTGVVRGAAVAGSFFDEAGALPMVGRFSVASDSAASRTAVVVLSYDLWAERFAKSPTVIGQTVDLDGKKTVVVGVAAAGFQIPDGALLWTPRGS